MSGGPGWQPPDGGHPGPPPQGPGPYGQPQYATQPLSEVSPQTPRRGPGAAVWVIVVLVVALVAGVGIWWFTNRGGEENRAEYCTTLSDLTHDGDLMAAFDELDSDGLPQLQQLVDDAPDAVAKDWQALQAMVESAPSSDDVGVDMAMEAIGHLQNIASDARDHCDLTLELPVGF